MAAACIHVEVVKRKGINRARRERAFAQGWASGRTDALRRALDSSGQIRGLN